MNKKEFYRELMENYTIDTERIKCNAKRKVPDHRRVSSVNRWVTSFGACAAAAAIVVVSLSVFGNKGVDIVDENLDGAIERLYAAEARYADLSTKQDTMDVYVSFKETLSVNEILIAFSAIDEDSLLKIPLLYTADGKCYKNSDELGDNLVFLGAKVTVPAGFFAELSSLKCVSLVEATEESDYDDKSFIPYSGSESVKPSTTIDEPIQIVLPEKTEPTVVVTTPEVTVPPVTAETTTEDEGSEATSEQQMTPSETSAASEVTESSTVSETEAEEAPQPIEIPVSGVLSARFISQNSLIVTTNDSILFFRLDENGALSLDTTFYAYDAKYAWVSKDGSSLFITACSGNGRDRLIYADGRTDTVTALDVSSITSGAEIASVVCSDDGSVMFIKTISIRNTYLYRAERNENNITISLAKEYGNAASALTYSNGVMYTAVTDAVSLKVKVSGVSLSDGAETEIGVFGGTVRCVRNSTLDTAVLIISNPNDGSEQYKLLTPEGLIIGIEGSGDVAFSPTNGNVFRVGDKYYLADDGAINEISAEEAKGYFTDTGTEITVYEYDVTVNDDGTAFLNRIL